MSFIINLMAIYKRNWILFLSLKTSFRLWNIFLCKYAILMLLILKIYHFSKLKFWTLTVGLFPFFIGIPSRHKFKPAFAIFSETSTPLYILFHFPVSIFFFYFLGAFAWSIITLGRSVRTYLTSFAVTC